MILAHDVNAPGKKKNRKKDGVLPIFAANIRNMTPPHPHPT